MSTTYKNQMNDSFTITKEFQAAAHYGTGIEQMDLTDTQAQTIAAATLAAVTGVLVTLTSTAARVLTTITAPMPVGQKFTLLNGNTTTADTFTITDATAFDCGGNGNIVLQPGEQIVLRGTGLATCEMVSTTGAWA